MSLQTLEHGRVYFLLQPRVQTPFPMGMEDVQRVLMILAPSDGATLRRVVMPHKRLPRVSGRRERFWILVDRVGDLSRVLDGLGPSTYETATRGERFQPGARLVAAGAYAVAAHEDHVHFSYALDPPAGVNDVGEAIGLQSSATYLLLAMRPFVGGRGTWRWRTFPEWVREAFGEKRFAPFSLPMLDLEGMNLVLIGAGRGDRPELAEAERLPEGDPLDRSLRAQLDGWRPRGEVRQSPQS